MPPQVEHGSTLGENTRWTSAQKFKDPAEAALLAAKYMAGLQRTQGPDSRPLAVGWIEDGSAETASLLTQFEKGPPDPE